MESPQTIIRRIVEQFDSANESMLVGDAAQWKDLMSHRDDVSLLGAYGGYLRGWAEVSARFDRTAAGYGAGAGGGRTSRESISTWIGTDLACVVDIEHHRAHLEGHAEPVVFSYRTTHVLRREDDSWRVVLRHADPLTSFRGPDFAHVDAQSAEA